MDIVTIDKWFDKQSSLAGMLAQRIEEHGRWRVLKSNISGRNPFQLKAALAK